MKRSERVLEKSNRGFRVRVGPRPEPPPEGRIQHLLEWILNQLNFGYFEVVPDDHGRIRTVAFGDGAGRYFDDEESAVKWADTRQLAVSIAGIMSDERVGGTEARHEELHKRVKNSLGVWGEWNTELGLAQEVLQRLGRLRKMTLRLDALPLKGVAPAVVIGYVTEATRLWMYGFDAATVALCRASLECALRNKLNGVDHEALDLNCLIEEAANKGLLEGSLKEPAHGIRRAANRLLHQGIEKETQSREILESTRLIVEKLFEQR